MSCPQLLKPIPRDDASGTTQVVPFPSRALPKIVTSPFLLRPLGGD